MQLVTVSFDLSQSLGINFDAKLVAKSVQEGSQASQGGVCSGWRALSVGEVPVETTKELVTMQRDRESAEPEPNLDVCLVLGGSWIIAHGSWFIV